MFEAGMALYPEIAERVRKQIEERAENVIIGPRAPKTESGSEYIMYTAGGIGREKDEWRKVYYQPVGEDPEYGVNMLADVMVEAIIRAGRGKKTLVWRDCPKVHKENHIPAQARSGIIETPERLLMTWNGGPEVWGEKYDRTVWKITTRCVWE